MKLESLELIELKYFYHRGFRYISKSEYLDGDIRIHKTEPYYYTKDGSHYARWRDESENQIWNDTMYSAMLQGDYSSLIEIEKPLLIEDLINKLERGNENE